MITLLLERILGSELELEVDVELEGVAEKDAVGLGIQAEIGFDRSEGCRISSKIKGFKALKYFLFHEGAEYLDGSTRGAILFTALPAPDPSSSTETLETEPLDRGCGHVISPIHSHVTPSAAGICHLPSTVFCTSRENSTIGENDI